jgi:DNA-binding NarL/FixJ family response regulator
MSDPIRILVADDHTLFRDGLRALFNSLADTEVAGEAATGEQAIGQAEKLQPDVVLMDIQMPGINGIEATRQIVKTSPHIGVVVVTMFEDDDSVFAAMRAGARGYVLKGSGQAEMLRVIRAGVRTMRVRTMRVHLKSEIAQLELSDLGRRSLAL